MKIYIIVKKKYHTNLKPKITIDFLIVFCDINFGLFYNYSLVNNIVSR